jgi:hypothetical protein
MATKKISELPLITALSGSQEETLIPVVVGGLNGTTNRITAENFSKFVNAYNATTSSNTFIGAQIINGNLTVTGNQVISGRLTVNELVAQYETASIIFSSGSNKFGDELTDKQEFTGSLDLVGNFILNGAQINNTLDKVHQATGSLQIFTASQDSRNFVISQYTSSTDAHIVGISDFTSSQLIVNTGLASVTASLNNFSGSTNAFTRSIERATASIHLATASLNYFYQSTSSLNEFTASQDSRNFVISQYTASTDAHIVGISQFTSSILSQNAGVASVTASLNAFTASQDSRNFVISQFTSSTNAHIVGISDFTSSQLAVNLGNSIYTASVDSHIVGISTYTSSVRDTLARVHQATRSLELHSGSMIGVTNGLMAYTASNTTLNAGLRDEVNGIESYTSSLKAAISVNGTNVQIIGDLNVNKLNVQYVSSSVLVTSGSNTFGDQSTDKHEFTGSIGVTGNLIGASDIQANKFVFTDGVVNTNVGGQKIVATNSNILYLYTGTSGLYINNQANNAQNVTITDAGVVTTRGGVQIGSSGNDQNLVFGGTNSSIYWGVGGPARMYYNNGDIKISSNGASDVLTVKNIGGVEISGGITGSLMATNGVVSGSQQIADYNRFAQTSSANTFYGDQTITGSLAIKDSETDFLIEGNGFSQTYLTSNGAIVLNPGYGGVEMVGSYRTFKASDITADGTLIVKGSTTLGDDSADTTIISGSLKVSGPLRGNTISGGLDVNGGITGSVKGNLDGVAAYASLLAVSSVGTTTDTSLYPTFTLSPILGSYTGLYSHLSGSFFLNGVTRQVVINDGGLLVTGSLIANSGITGSLMATNGVVSSSQQITNYYKFAETASANTFYGNQSVRGNVIINAGNSLRLYEPTNTNYWDTYTYTDNTLRVNYNGAGGDEIILYNDGGISFNGALTASIYKVNNGGGIDFSATSNGSGTMSSELLNDYEEGTFTPTFVGTNLTISSYGNRAGFYTKIGRLVTVTINIMTEGLSASGAEAVRIGGLPFTAASTAESTNSANIFNSARWTANPPICGDVGLNTTEINLYSDRGPVGAGTDPTTAKTTDMAIGTGNRNMVRLTATYFTA